MGEWVTMETVVMAGAQLPASPPELNRVTSQGCFSSISDTSTWLYTDSEINTAETCAMRCKSEKQKPVALVRKAKCYCAGTYPPANTLVNDSVCNWRCRAYPRYACGGFEQEAYSVTNSGLELYPGYGEHEPIRLDHVETPMKGLQKHWGCVKGTRSDDIMHELPRNSPGACHQACEASGKMILLLTRNKCFCSDFYPSSDMIVPEGKCDMACVGDKSAGCGGYDWENYVRVLDVYEANSWLLNTQQKNQARPLVEEEDSIQGTSPQQPLQLFDAPSRASGSNADPEKEYLTLTFSSGVQISASLEFRLGNSLPGDL
ncbi:uncharacterized protein BKA55DRAFT_561935 [Fusarium redolens]|uniref:WSC domain-containing protein n=1 Tax=Fusarium redolens TaxID=48865 RepID=A0A9P9KMH8_FUSRE|nr:uncharacterized protein BKA55DRAFT_561935 [Fusarium redolens]KAH7259019.1 hypothetical protein BKA55DRAFT_561935 [Fusarium redolens]